MGAPSHSGLDLCLHLYRVWVLIGAQIGHDGLWRDWAAESSEEKGPGTHLCHRLGAGLRSAVTLMVTKSSETDSLNPFKSVSPYPLPEKASPSLPS